MQLTGEDEDDDVTDDDDDATDKDDDDATDEDDDDATDEDDDEDDDDVTAVKDDVRLLSDAEVYNCWIMLLPSYPVSVGVVAMKLNERRLQFG